MKITLFDVPSCGTLIIAGSNGLIGGVLTNYLTQLNEPPHCRKKTLEVGYKDISMAINELIKSSLERDHLSSLGKIYIIYACGKGGFNIPEDIASQQVLVLSSLVNSLLARSRPEIRLLYLSSLGANLSTYDSNYKKMIEHNEAKVNQYGSSTIIRLPGIWGYKQYGSQWTPCGLIGHLLSSSMTFREVLIFADLKTTRHYLSAEAVAKTIVKMIKYEGMASFPRLQNLFSPTPLSISEIISTIGFALSKRVYYKLQAGSAVDRESLLKMQYDFVRDHLVLESLSTEIKVACLKVHQASPWLSHFTKPSSF
jgi:hypothetical protein